MVSYTAFEIHANNASVVRSPKLAAIGVLILSGLIRHSRESIMTSTITNPKIIITTHNFNSNKFHCHSIVCVRFHYY